MADAEIVDFLNRRKAQDAGAAMVATRSSNPDAAARANVLARRLGLPADAIERQLPEVEGREQLSVARSLIERYPAIGNWMSEARNAAMGRDDVENLARVVKTFNGLPSTFAQKKLPFVRATPEEVRAARRPDGGFMASSDRIDAIMFEDNLNKFLTAAQEQAQDSTFELITRGPEAIVRGGAAGIPDFTAGVYGLARAATEIGADYSPVSYAQRKLFGRSIEDGIAQWFAEKQAEGQALAAQVAGAPLESRVGRDIVAGVRSVPMTAAALAASAAGAPQAGAALIGASVAGQEYGRARDKGISPVQSAIYAGSQGIIEYATERVPALKYFEDTKAGATFTRKLINNLGSEMPQEQVATVLQDLNEWAILNPDKPFSDYLDERPNAALSTAIATATGSIVTTTSIEAAGRLVNGAAKAALRRQEAEAAIRTGELLDGLSKVDSKVRKRDPEAYGEFVSQFTDGTTIEDTYLNGEKVTELFQSGVINPEDSKWLYDVVSPQMGGVQVTGGDYVIPTADFVSQVAGTPAWDALKDFVRFSPAGMSVDEARQYEKDEAKAFEEMGRQFADDVERQRLEMRPREVLYEAIRDKLTNAGFTQSAADLNASMVAARYATRAQRLGKELTGAEADGLVVNQVLPEKLAPVVAADQLDLAIEAMKRGRGQRSDAQRFGPSLAEFIAKRGGIEDTGGELKDMGADKWHRGKPGRRKLIRERAGADLLGRKAGNDNTPDAIALAAWEAGYFPNLSERPTVDDLLQALGQEVRGKPIYAEDRTEQGDRLRAAADELYELLDRQGVDPDKASPKDIRQAVERYQAERSEGRGYDQVDPKSEAFKRWFGDSKVVDADGKPLVMYHGTRGDIEAFDKERIGERFVNFTIGIHFSSNPSEASLYADSFANMETGWNPQHKFAKEVEAGANVVPVYLKVENPLVIDSGSKLAASFADDNRSEIIRKIVESRRNAGKDVNAEINDLLKELGDDSPPLAPKVVEPYDGIIIRSSRGDEWDATNVIVFEPSQIKSAFNRGPIDPNDARILYQSYADGPRGRITFTEGRNIIDLFQSRDLSTFIHETGHLWLEELRVDAESPDAPEQLKADWDAVQKWFAANGHPLVDGAIPVEAHELWARGWERYAMEGKAPSSILRRVFDAFRGWLLSIYKVVDNLRSPITPEIREVMDRLIATDEEIKETAEAQNIKALFTDAAQAGMTEAEFAAYQKATLECRDEAFDALLYRTMEAIRRQRLQWWKDERAGVEAEVRERVNRRPEFRALDMLRGKEPRIKLDKQWLIETYGEDGLALLPKAIPPIYADKDTTHADVVAEMNGFRSGDEMVRTLMGVEQRTRELREGGDKRSVRQVLIADEADAIMRDRHGDPLSDGSIQEEALAAIHNEKQGEVIASELRALSRRADRQPTPYKLAREWAARTVAESRVVDSTSGAALQRYAKAAAKAGKLAEEAMLRGDVEETFRQKQAQMLNNALIAEAKKAKEAADAAIARLGKLARKATIASIDQAYLDQVHGLLEQVDFRPVSQRSLDRQESFEEWANAQTAAGYDVVVPPSFAERLGKRNWSRLSVEELLGLDETVKQIVHLGRLKQKLIDAKEEREFEAVVNEALGSVSRLPPLPPSDLMEPSRWDAIKGRVASMDAALLKMETVFDWLDGKDPNGVFNRVVFRRIADAQDAEKAMQSDYIGRLTELLRQLPKAQLARWSEKVTAPELLNRETGNPWVLTRDQLISVALNMGNEGNADKLARGYGWNRDAIMRVLDRELSADDWRYIQGVWDIIETLWPQIAAMEKRLNGVEPEKVEATPLQTSAGPLRGGYFPVVYDPRKSIDADVQAAKNSDSLFENVYTKATTPKGFTKARTNVARPIHLSLGVINRHVAEVIHDLTHREAIMDADRFLGDRRVMEAVDNTLGPEVRKQFRPWLQHIANEWANDRKGLTGWEAFAKRLRTNSTMVGMGFRISTIIMQAAGYSNTAERIGAKWVLQGIGAAAKNPLAAWRFVSERSGEVRNRMDTLERDIRENVRSTLGKHDVLSEARRFAFYGIGMMDRVVVIPTWIGAYNRAITEGMSEEEAGYFADKAVRQSQGAGAAKDLAAVQRSNEFMRLVTMFYSYQSAVYQRFRSLGRDIGTARSQDIPHLVARSFFLIAVPPLLSQLLAGRGPDDDEDWAMWAFQQMLLGLFGPIPLARDAANALESGFGYSFTPAARAFETGLNVVKDARKVIQGEETTRATRNALEATGYVFGLPTGQLATAAQFIVDVSEGEKDPNSVGDWWQGLTTGKIDD